MQKHNTAPPETQDGDGAIESEHCCTCEFGEQETQRFDTIVCAAVVVVNDCSEVASRESAAAYLTALFDAERKRIEIDGLPKL